MKKFLALLLALVMVLSFAACSQEGKTSEPESNPESVSEPESSEPEEPATAASYKLGMGVSVSTASSKATKAQVDATVATVVLDAEGKIVAADLDVAQTYMDITDGVANPDSIDARTKKEKKADYNMKPASPIGKEWYEQAEAFCEYVIGKTGAEISALETKEENGHNVAVDETLYAGCTMDITAFVDAFTKACNDQYAKEFSADEFKLGLAAITTSDASTASATADAEGSANMYTEFAAVVVDKDGKILADLIDTIQPKIGFDAKGEITTVTFNGTKKELRNDYNMVTYGGAIAEWFEQATTFENYIVGKTADEVNAIATVTNAEGYQVATEADADLVAGCTMAINGYQESVTKAIANAK